MDILLLGFVPSCIPLLARKLKRGPPSSTDSVIIFPLYHIDKKFSRAAYSPEMTDEKVSSEEIDKALNLFEIAVSREPTKISIMKNLFIRFFFPLFVLTWFEGEYWWSNSESAWSYMRSELHGRLVGIKILLWLLVFVYYVIGIVYLYKNDIPQNKRNRVADVQSIIELVQPGYLERGLKWRVPEETFDWIELVKEYKINEQIKEISDPVAQAYENMAENAEINTEYEPPENLNLIPQRDDNPFI